MKRRKIDENIIDKLLHAFAIGCNNLEACAYAEIGESTLYTLIKDNPDLQERIERAKRRQVLKALTASDRLLDEGDPIHTRWILERRKREDYTLTHDVSIHAEGALTIDEKRDAIHDYLTTLTGSTGAPDGEKGDPA